MIGNIIGVVFTIIFGILAVVFYFRSKREKEPCWAIRNSNLIKDYSSVLTGLAITYQNAPVETLSISRIMLWNRGTQTIDSTDIASANPLRIQAKGNVRLLSCQLLATNAASNQFTVTPPLNGTATAMTFDYLDKEQGAVIQIVHTGSSGEDLEVVGNIKGVTKLQRKNIRVYSLRAIPRWFELPLLIAWAVVSLASIWMIIFRGLGHRQTFLVLIPWIVLTSWSLPFFQYEFQIRRNKVPKGLEVFTQDITP